MSGSKRRSGSCGRSSNGGDAALVGDARHATGHGADSGAEASNAGQSMTTEVTSDWQSTTASSSSTRYARQGYLEEHKSVGRSHP